MDARLLGILASTSAQSVVIDDYLWKFDFSPTMPNSAVLVGDKYDVSNGYSALVNTDNGITVVDEGGGNAYLVRASAVGNVNLGVAETGYLSPLSAISLDTQGTFSYWIKTSTTSRNFIASVSNNGSSNTRILFGVGRFDFVSGATNTFVNFDVSNVIVDTWQLHTFKTDGTVFLKYYIDGVEQAVSSTSGTNALSGTRNWIGRLASVNAMHIGWLDMSSGDTSASLEIYEMDAISYYQRELSDAEIAALYTAGR